MRVTEKEFHNRCVRLDPLALDLRDCRAELEGVRGELTGTIEALRRTQNKWQSEVTRLREALRKYGDHTIDCATNAVDFAHVGCTCGFDAALDGGKE